MSENNDIMITEEVAHKFTMITHPTSNQYFFKIINDDDFAGVIYSYDKIQFNEDTGESLLQYDYDIVDAPKGKDAKVIADDDNFKDLIGQILVHVIELGIRSKNYQLVEAQNTNDRNNDSATIDQQ